MAPVPVVKNVKPKPPPARGGRAVPVNQKVTGPRPRPPRIVGVGPPESPAHVIFRQTLAQINALSPQVDEAAIRKPYDTASVVAGQLGQGFQAATAASSQNAMNQYTQAHNEIQQRAAQFGAGTGAPVEAVPDTGTGLLAQQTAAQQAAAGAAAAAWRSMLNQAATGAVSQAQLDRQKTLDTSRQSLALAYPGIVSEEKNRALQQKTEADNMRALYAQLTEKQRSALTDEKLRGLGIQATIRGQDISASNTALRTSETQRHNLATEKATAAKQRAAAKAGVKGIKEVMALNPKAGSTVNRPAGFRATIQQYDTDGNPLGPAIQGVHLADARPGHEGLKNGWRVVGQPQPATVKATAGKEGFDWGRYRQQISILIGSNPTWNDGKPMTRAQAASYLPPTPKTGKKK